MAEVKAIQEMAYRVGVTSDNYVIYVNSVDVGNKPHFHYVENISMGKEFHTCIRIDKAEYFFHEDKNDTLNNKQKNELQKFLSNPFKRPKFTGSNWEFSVMVWNDNNSKMVLDEENTKMPDYENL